MTAEQGLNERLRANSEFFHLEDRASEDLFIERVWRCHTDRQLVISDGLVLELAIRTTRIFRWTNERWRQIHHHGSIDNPDVLAHYQQAVLKRAA